MRQYLPYTASTKQVDILDFWIKNALQLQMREINTFIRGISRDLEAMKNAIALKYNNGLAERSVNKLKTCKAANIRS